MKRLQLYYRENTAGALYIVKIMSCHTYELSAETSKRITIAA